jgi:hypothetical protein
MESTNKLILYHIIIHSNHDDFQYIDETNLIYVKYSNIEEKIEVIQYAYKSIIRRRFAFLINLHVK